MQRTPSNDEIFVEVAAEEGQSSTRFFIPGALLTQEELEEACDVMDNEANTAEGDDEKQAEGQPRYTAHS